jgi:glycerol kinase
VSYLLALDQGTSSSRAVVFDQYGQAVARAQQELTLQYPRPGWVETDAAALWKGQLAVARSALAGFAPRSIAAIGVTNQRETTVLWERATGAPLAQAIVWQDRRTADYCERLRESGHGPLIAARTGLIIDPYFSATKLAWLLDNVAGARARAARGALCFGTVDSYLLFMLSGGALHATDPSNAARTMLFNIHTGAWDDELLALFDIPRSVLPDIVPSSGVCGHTDAALFGAPIALAGIAGDQQAATFGQACYRPGMVKNTYGTGCFMLQNTGSVARASQHRLLTTVGWELKGQTTFLLEASVFMGGATVQWLRDSLGIIGHSGEVEALAASVPDTGGVMMVPAFTGLGAPYWDPGARATLLGMTRSTSRAHIARAALESIALQSADLMCAMELDAGTPVNELRVDGGASANDLLMQFQADVLGVPVLRPGVTETTALGAAYLAGLGCGVWAGLDEIAAHWQLERAFEPRRSDDWREASLARWRRAVALTRSWQEQGAQ